MATITPSPSASPSGSPTHVSEAVGSSYEDRVVSQVFFVVTIMIPVLLSTILLFLRRKARERAQRNHELARASRNVRSAPPALSEDEVAVLHIVPFDRAAVGPDFRCTICLEEPAEGAPLVLLPCGHSFDQSCAISWFSRSTFCALCKADALGRGAREISPWSPSNVLIVRDGGPHSAPPTGMAQTSAADAPAQPSA